MAGAGLEVRRAVALPDGGAVTSVWRVPAGYAHGARIALALGHGAGSDMDAPLLLHLQDALVEHDILSVRFNFPYRERGAKPPDRAPVLEQTWRAVLRQLRNDPQWAPRRLYAGGHSMGARMASRIAAEDGDVVDGLVMLAYPLHPARKPEQLRTAHFPRLQCPCLFVQGERDALCDLTLLGSALDGVPGDVQLHVIACADHSFKLLKRCGRSQAEVRNEIAEVVRGWLR